MTRWSATSGPAGPPSPPRPLQQGAASRRRNSLHHARTPRTGTRLVKYDLAANATLRDGGRVYAPHRFEACGVPKFGARPGNRRFAGNMPRAQICTAQRGVRRVFAGEACGTDPSSWALRIGGEADTEPSAADPPQSDLRSLRETAQAGPSAHDLPGTVTSPLFFASRPGPENTSTGEPKRLRPACPTSNVACRLPAGIGALCATPIKRLPAGEAPPVPVSAAKLGEAVQLRFPCKSDGTRFTHPTPSRGSLGRCLALSSWVRKSVRHAARVH
jgi:hypothetical protein